MPLQNRVDPWGRLQAVSDRGTLLGNRGILHNSTREIVARWRTKAWITCQLEWKGWRRTVMRPGTWTELFFLDEVTAFAAGHRPCAYCRRTRFHEFKVAWLTANPLLVSTRAPRIAEIDAILHTERTRKDGEKVCFDAKLSSLPDGTMIAIATNAYVVWNQRLLRWSFSGYAEGEVPWQGTQCVSVLTPASIVRMFRHGFQPWMHESGHRA